MSIPSIVETESGVGPPPAAHSLHIQGTLQIVGFANPPSWVFAKTLDNERAKRFFSKYGQQVEKRTFQIPTPKDPPEWEIPERRRSDAAPDHVNQATRQLLSRGRFLPLFPDDPVL